jgi:hypothetical protein
MHAAPRPRRCAPRLLLAAAALACAAAARADLQDEIQVYDDSINAPGERGLELHVNTTPRGRRTPGYPGEVPPARALRVTPEFSLGLTRSFEAGLYLPTIWAPGRGYEAAGLKLRAKWLPLQTQDGQGAFAGLNVELSRLAQRYSESRTSAEARFIAGWRNADWLLAVNPTFGFDLSPGFRGQRPAFDLGVKVSRRVGDGLAAGVETYSGLGAAGRTLPWREQDQRVFLALDVDRAPWVFNVGVGYGLTPASDRWTLKAIFEVPLP